MEYLNILLEIIGGKGSSLGSHSWVFHVGTGKILWSRISKRVNPKSNNVEQSSAGS